MKTIKYILYIISILILLIALYIWFKSPFEYIDKNGMMHGDGLDILLPLSMIISSFILAFSTSKIKK